jgi:L-alanine-DL-glutamate epimerase-like enolase superfamily enzyme
MSPTAPALASTQVGWITQLDVYRVTLPLATPLAHSQVDTAVLDDVFLVMTLADGTEGSAEVRGNGAYATRQDAAAVIAAIEACAPSLMETRADLAGSTVLARTGNRLAAALLEGAAVDALARAAALPLWRYLGKQEAPILETHASIPFCDPAEADILARAAAALGFRRLKIRVGAEDAERDVVRVRAVRKAAPHAHLMVDANGAWPTAAAVAMTHRLQPFGVAWLEQPTAAGDDAALREVRIRGGLDVVADESVHTAEDVQRLIAAGAVDGVHLKLEKCGTRAELRRAAVLARNAGLLVEIGMMDQGRLGSAIVAAVAATTPADAYELWGFERVAQDVARGIEIEAGAVRLSDQPGHGLEVDLPADARVGTWR